ncbi:MAG TPA: hypothetical protein VGL72_02265, partial [Bryobacteraceae bacterium]
DSKLDLRPIEELESEGAGPETLAALDLLREKSAALQPSSVIPPFKSPARPTIDEQKEYFRKIDINAMHYIASLPDFICTELVHRYQMIPARPPGSTLRRGQSLSPVGAGFWQSKDTLTVKLTYFGNQEKYQLILVNGRKTKEDYESSGGAISEGDFGSTLLEIFRTDSGTKFQWDHWTHLRKRLTRVYSFRTSREKSHARIGVGENPKERRTVIVGRHGFIYADDETAMVMRIVAEADSIPLGFPITSQSTMLDFDYANVGEKRFLLPLRVDNRLKTSMIYFKNVVQFTDYRKFTGESTISFEGPDIPDTPEKK